MTNRGPHEDPLDVAGGGLIDPNLDDTETGDYDASGNPVPIVTHGEEINLPDQPFDLGPASDERMDGGSGSTPGDNPDEAELSEIRDREYNPDRLRKMRRGRAE